MKNKVQFNLDVPQLLIEITNNENIGILKIPLNILREKLVKVGEVAIKLNDPELNILMLEMKIYEMEHSKIYDEIEKQKQLLKK